VCDMDLLALAISGDEAAENALFNTLQRRLRLLARRRLGDSHIAEDIAQEACLTVAQKYKTERYEIGFEEWAYGVLRMKIGNYLQKRNTERKIMSRSESDRLTSRAELKADPILRRNLLKCLKKIVSVNKMYARALNLVYQGYKTSEICSRLKINSGNYYVVLSRGRSMLRTCLETGVV